MPITKTHFNSGSEGPGGTDPWHEGSQYYAYGCNTGPAYAIRPHADPWNADRRGKCRCHDLACLCPGQATARHDNHGAYAIRRSNKCDPDLRYGVTLDLVAPVGRVDLCPRSLPSS